MLLILLYYQRFCLGILKHSGRCGHGQKGPWALLNQLMTH